LSLDRTLSLSRRALLSGVGTAALALQAGAASAAARPLYKDPLAPAAARVEDLLARMTLEEKVLQMQCIWSQKATLQDARGEFDPDKARAGYPHGLGMIARPSDRWGVAPLHGKPDDNWDGPNRTAGETAIFVNAAQRWAVEQTRLGIPLVFHEEALHGYVAREATCFPQAIGLASSFDPQLVTRVFAVAAREMRVRGAILALAPVVDVARDPRWGRIEETYGEDPHLCGEIGKAAVRGLTGDVMPLAPDKVFATLKHMTGHGQPENGTNTGPAEISERTLREVFFPPFQKIIRETQVGAVMPSYNEIDGVPSHANRWLLGTVLRDEWGFKGVTVSDYAAVKELMSRHHLVPDLKEAAFRAITAGVDMETPERDAYAAELAGLVRAGRVPESAVDAAVRRILMMKVQAGLFEHPYADVATADARTSTPNAVALARTAAARTVVLLKNDKNLLPLKAAKLGRLLVLGTHARDTPIGGYSEVPRRVVSILEGLEAEGRREGFEVAYSEGVRLTEGHSWEANTVRFTDPAVNARLIADAVDAAKSADTILMVLGDNEQTSREAWSDNHMGDRLSLDLIGQQNDLAKAIFDLGKPTIVFLLNGRPLAVNLLAERADALIEGWYMGQETGHAAADILFGRANPGGKLPVSIARSVGQLPIFYNYKPSARRGYLDGTTTPLYPFGYGLSYTRFEISAPRLSRPVIGAAENVICEVEVVNVGAVAGDEVVQLYIRDEVSSVTRPVLELKHFRRVTLAPGSRATLTFDITSDDLAFYDTQMRRVVEPGDFTIYAGPDSVALKSVKLTVV
jgi:beta-glucosidase